MTPEYTWINVREQAPFAPRDGLGLLSHHGKLWLLGGWNPSDSVHFPRICVNEVWSSEDGVDWRLIKPNTFLDETFDSSTDWDGRHTVGWTVLRDRMWIVGGDCYSRTSQFDVWCSADGRHWERVCDRVPWAPRVLHHTVAFRDALWIMGGQTLPQFVPDVDAFYRDVWRSANGRDWTRVADHLPWGPRGMIGGQAVFKDRMWILGGGTYDTPGRPERAFYNDVWSSADGRHWECHLEKAPWEPRQYHEVAVFDQRLWVLEGWRHGNRNDVWHSGDGVHWHELPDTPWAPRHAAGVAVHGNALWLVGGNHMQSDVWKLIRRPESGRSHASREWENAE